MVFGFVRVVRKRSQKKAHAKVRHLDLIPMIQLPFNIVVLQHEPGMKFSYTKSIIGAKLQDNTPLQNFAN